MIYTFEYSLGFGDDNNYDNDTDQRSFEWFVMMSALCKTGSGSPAQEENRDLITGLKTRTQTGRPDCVGEGNTNNHSKYLV